MFTDICYLFATVSHVHTIEREIFEGENFRGSVYRKGAFCKENFRRMLNWSHNGCGMPRISWRKLSRMAEKSQNS